jgi:hypothetical protein
MADEMDAARADASPSQEQSDAERPLEADAEPSARPANRGPLHPNRSDGWRDAASSAEREPTQSSSEATSKAGFQGVAILVGIVVLVLAVIGGLGGSGEPSIPDAYGGGEAWDQDYNTTTCLQWRADMTSGQQLTVASDMLIGLRESNGGGSGLPPEHLVSEFRDGICPGGAGESDLVHVMATLLYFAGTSVWNG